MASDGGRVKTKAGECPDADLHTPQPTGYIHWHTWAERMTKTHRQVKCKGCDRYEVWIPRVPEVSRGE